MEYVSWDTHRYLLEGWRFRRTEGGHLRSWPFDRVCARQLWPTQYPWNSISCTNQINLIDCDIIVIVTCPTTPAGKLSTFLCGKSLTPKTSSSSASTSLSTKWPTLLLSTPQASRVFWSVTRRSPIDLRMKCKPREWGQAKAQPIRKIKSKWRFSSWVISIWAAPLRKSAAWLQSKRRKLRSWSSVFRISAIINNSKLLRSSGSIMRRFWDSSNRKKSTSII